MTGPTLSSVDNALHILQVLADEDPGVGVTDLSKKLGCAKSTTHRLLATLASRGFVRQLDDGRYALGYALWELGSRMVGRLSLREIAHPILEGLRNKTGETVHLAILDGADVLYIDRFESQATLTLFRRLGHRMPAHATSTGKAILAFSTPEVVDRVLAVRMKRLAPNTITNKKALLKRLEEIAVDGLVVSVEESERAVASVGAPIFDFQSQVVAAVSIAGPAQRFPASAVELFKRHVRKAANDISKGLGYPAAMRALP